jgi:hypothetical protein
MRYITIPTPVIPTTVLGEAAPGAQPFTFREFLALLAGDAKLVHGLKGGDAVLRAADVAKAVQSCPTEPGATLALENDHYERLAAVLADPSEPFNPRSQHSLAPHVRAFRSASDTPPQS